MVSEYLVILICMPKKELRLSPAINCLLASWLGIESATEHSLPGCKAEEWMRCWGEESYLERSGYSRPKPSSLGKECCLDLQTSEMRAVDHCSLGCCGLVSQLCLTLCNPTDCSLIGYSVHGIFQIRILEWIPISCSRVLPNTGMEFASPVLAGGWIR